jgi:hypothetical protein
MEDRREFLSVAGRIAGSIALASGSGFARAMHTAEKLVLSFLAWSPGDFGRWCPK